MRIGIDAFPMCPHFGDAGVPRSVREILRCLQQIDQENEYLLYSKLDFEFAIDNPRWRKCLHPHVPYLLGSVYLNDGTKGPSKAGLDVFWATRTYAFPFGLPQTTARVITVYDLVWLLYPETMERLNRIAFKVWAKRGISHADRIVSISESTCRSLGQLLGTPSEKISVVHLAAGPRFRPHDRASAARFIAEKYGVSTDYICAVGTIEPRKNLITLIEAVGILKARGQLRHQLLVAGGAGWRNSGIYSSVERCGLSEREVKFLGRLPEDDLVLLYPGAALFVFPSLYEGFGLPLLEAMASGVPVVASNASSVPEVVQDAAILVSPMIPGEFADAIAKINGDQEIARSLAERSRKRAQEFTWEAAARKVLHIFEEVALARGTRRGSHDRA